MVSLGLSLLLFSFWTGVGLAVQSLFKLRLGILRTWLLAPGIGIAVTCLGLTFGNQAGAPIGSFAWPLTLSLAAASVAVIVWRRPKAPFRALAPFLFAVVFSLIWTAWPALKFGFHWISYVNDDFANYCLAAERFKDFGFYRVPTHEELSGRDYTQYYWFMHTLQLMRFGSEHALAWAAALTGRPALQIFMPEIVAFGMAQIFATAGLVLQAGKYRRQAAWAAVLLSFSPMFMFGSLYQLIAQVGGVCLLITLIALMTAHLATRRRLRVLAYAVPSSIVGAALCIFYPEVTLFAVMAIGLYVFMRAVRSRSLPGAHIVLIEYTIVGVVVLMRYNFISYLYTLGNQFVGGTRHVDLALSLFPFFLLPSGLASALGFQPMNFEVPDPVGSLLIVAGLIVWVAILVSAIRGTLRAKPVYCLLFSFAVLTAWLYQSGNDFGLYKAVMWMQPALMAAVAGILAARTRARWIAMAGAGVFFAATASTGLVYTRSSTGVHAGMLSEVGHASDLFAQMPDRPPAAAHWTSDIDNVSAAKLAAAMYRGADVKFVCRDYFYPVYLPEADWPFMGLYPHRELFALGREMMKWREQDVFVPREVLGAKFTETVEEKHPDAFLDSPTRLSLFNKLHLRTSKARSGEKSGLFVIDHPSDLENNLAFIHSDLGNQYYLGDRRKIAYFQQQPDAYNQPNGDFNGIGRFLLLRVERPSDPLFVRIAATKTLMSGGRTVWSDGARILGKTNVPIGAVGGGAMNVIVGPVSPVWLDAVAYIAIDFDQAPSAYPVQRHGLKALYNGNLSLDYRRLVAYARDISALSPGERDALPRPKSIRHFPADLVGATGLEFSGIYEDGWLSPKSAFVLGAAKAGDALRLRGSVRLLPGFATDGDLSVTIGGASFHVTSQPGDFDWVFPVSASADLTRVGISFSASGSLPNGDDRPVAAQLDSLALAPFPSNRFDYATPGAPRPATTGVDQDGWAKGSDEIVLPVEGSVSAIKFALEYPGWPGVPAEGSLGISVDGGPFVYSALKPGPNTVIVPNLGKAGVRRVRLDAKPTFRLPAPDGRERAFRLNSIEEVGEGPAR